MADEEHRLDDPEQRKVSPQEPTQGHGRLQHLFGQGGAIQVADHGVGIAERKRELIFEPSSGKGNRVGSLGVEETLGARELSTVVSRFEVILDNAQTC